MRIKKKESLGGVSVDKPVSDHQSQGVINLFHTDPIEEWFETHEPSQQFILPLPESSGATKEDILRMWREDYYKPDPKAIAYRLQLEESDGFDIKDYECDRLAIGKIRALDLTYKDMMAEAMTYAGYAISAYNKKYKGKRKRLELDRVKKSMIQGACGVQYYLTFRAYNPIKDKKKTYQAIVTGPFRDYEVTAFRTKPKVHVPGQGLRKKWKWDNRCCSVRKTEEQKPWEQKPDEHGGRPTRPRRPPARLEDYVTKLVTYSSKTKAKKNKPVMNE